MAMTREDYRNAAAETLALAMRHNLDNDESDTPDADYPHLAEMANKMRTDDSMSLEKLGRWLGWMQGCVYCRAGGEISLEEMKDINMRNSDNARAV